MCVWHCNNTLPLWQPHRGACTCAKGTRVRSHSFPKGHTRTLGRSRNSVPSPAFSSAGLLSRVWWAAELKPSERKTSGPIWGICGIKLRGMGGGGAECYMEGSCRYSKQERCHDCVTLPQCPCPVATSGYTREPITRVPCPNTPIVVREVFGQGTRVIDTHSRWYDLNTALLYHTDRATPRDCVCILCDTNCDTDFFLKNKVVRDAFRHLYGQSAHLWFLWQPTFTRLGKLFRGAVGLSGRAGGGGQRQCCPCDRYHLRNHYQTG